MSDEKNNKNINDYLDKKINKITSSYKIKSTNIVKKNLILNGGGVKGIVHIGALKALDEKNMLKNITTIVGTSIGGIIGGLYCIGYSPDELFKFVNLFDLKNLRSLNPSNIICRII